jgi:hypothetical protein
MEDITKTAVGVFIGALAALFVYEGITVLRLEYAVYKAQQHVKAEQAKQRAAEAASRQQQQDLQQQRQRDAEAERASQLQRQQEQAQRDRARQQAWERFYAAPEICKQDPGTVYCANSYMRARRQFEEQYRS